MPINSQTMWSVLWIVQTSSTDRSTCALFLLLFVSFVVTAAVDVDSVTMIAVALVHSWNCALVDLQNETIISFHSILWVGPLAIHCLGTRRKITTTINDANWIKLIFFSLLHFGSVELFGAVLTVKRSQQHSKAQLFKLLGLPQVIELHLNWFS